MAAPIRRGIVVHGGAGSSATVQDGCARAAAAGLAALRLGRGALDAAIAAVVSLEDDGRFNAGSGSVLRLDGVTLEMDAAVMDSEGALGAVAAVTAVKNPILLAREVARTPHVLFAGPGADALARHLGFTTHPGPTPQALARHRALVKALRSGPSPGTVRGWDWDLVARLWNFAAGMPASSDTVGAVAVEGSGVVAVATSTGGSSPMLRGRVGDTPLVGCGFYTGEHGAVAATGLGEEIMRRVASLLVYQELARGASPQEACEKGVSLFERDVPVGFIAVGPGGHGAASNREMAWQAAFE